MKNTFGHLEHQKDMLPKLLDNARIKGSILLNIMVTLESTLRTSHDWAIDRIHILSVKKDYEDARAIQSEFSEWLNPDIPDHDIFSLTFIGDFDENRPS